MKFEAKIYPGKEWKVPLGIKKEGYRKTIYHTKKMNSEKLILELKKSLENEGNEVKIIQEDEYTLLKTTKRALF